MKEVQKAWYSSPIGVLEIIGSVDGVSSILFIERTIEEVSHGQTGIPECLQECVHQLDEYFKGERKEFTVKLDMQGTDFQKRVWTELQNIPFGSTTSYLDISIRLGDKKSIRAVGGANGKNMIPIIIPCHRVIGSDGALTGYAGGLWRKQWLLAFENPSLQESLFE